MSGSARVSGPPLDRGGLRWVADYPRLGDPAKAAIVFDGNVTSYGALDEQADRMAAALRGLGIVAGDRVAYLGKNSDAFFIVFFGALRAGAVIVPLNWRCTTHELSAILADAAPRLLIADDEFAALAPDLAGEGMRTLTVGGPSGVMPVAAATAPASWPKPAADAPALMMYTSGTTGRAKGVVMTHEMIALARHVETLTPGYDSWTDDDVLLSAMPNFHIGGLSWMLCGLSRGLTCVLTADPSPASVIALCRAHSAAHTFLVPVAIRGVVEALEASGERLPHLKQIHYGAAPMDPTLLAQCFDVIGCGFMHHFGMTENAGTATRLGPEDHDPARPWLLQSVGRPQPGLELAIRRHDGTLAEIDEPGEIWLRSPTVTPGYWQRPDATAEALADGWYRSGDGGRLDADGFLYLTDRIKEMIISGGENIYPGEVENALRSHPAVLDAAVFGTPDDRWGEVVNAAVEFRPGLAATAAELEAHVRTQIAGYKIPRRFHLACILPRTASGKVQRGEARRLVEQTPSVVPEPHGP